MSKGTASLGKRGRAKLHIKCRRCGKVAFHKKHKICASCGFGESSRLKVYKWAWKAKSKR